MAHGLGAAGSVEVRRPLREGDVIEFGAQAAVFRIVGTQALAWIEQDARCPFGSAPSASPRQLGVITRLRALAPTTAPILLRGRGSLDPVARSVHAASNRSGAFVPLDCAALPGERFWEELFVIDSERNLLTQAEGGTLFLGNVDHAPPQRLVALLRLLSRKAGFAMPWIRRRPDVRLIAGTALPAALEAEVLALFGGEGVGVPPLERRKEDIGFLAAQVLQGLAHENRPRGFSVHAFRALIRHDWPADVEELEDVLARASLIAHATGATRIELDHLPGPISEAVRIGSECVEGEAAGAQMHARHKRA